jgi:hypothetical protein
MYSATVAALRCPDVFIIDVVDAPALAAAVMNPRRKVCPA